MNRFNLYSLIYILLARVFNVIHEVETLEAAMFELFKDKMVYIDKFLINCPNTDPPTYYKEMTGSGFGGQMTFNYTIVNKITLPAPMSLIVDIQRCKNKENPDSCIKFASFRTNRLCNLLESTTEFWSPMIVCAKPKLGCPLHKGIYVGTNCTLDMSRFNWFPLGEMYWKLKVQLQVRRNEQVACAIVEGKIVPKRQ